VDNLSVLRVILKEKSDKLIMKSNEIQSKEIPITIDALVDIATNAWNEIKASRLTIRVDPI